MIFLFNNTTGVASGGAVALFKQMYYTCNYTRLLDIKAKVQVNVCQFRHLCIQLD